MTGSETARKPAPQSARPLESRWILLRLLLINALIGALVAVIVVAGLVMSDAHRIGTLILQSEHPALPIAMLIGAFVVTFGSIAMGCAVMALPYKSDDGGDEERPKGGRASILPSSLPSPMAGLVPARVPAIRRPGR